MYFWVFKKKLKYKDIKLINIAMIPSNKFKIKNDIKNRLYKMIKEGLIDEIFFLYNQKKINIKNNSIKSIGYKDFWLYFLGEQSFQETIERIINSTNNLFTKQLTWLKKWKDDIFLIENDDKELFLKLSILFKKHEISKIKEKNDLSEY